MDVSSESINAGRLDRRSRWEALNRKAVHDAVVRILARDGSEALTMDHVASEAGMAKGTLYSYFKSKDELLEWVKDVSLEPLRHELAGILESDLPPDEKLRRFVSRQLGYFEEHRGFFRVLLWERLASTAGFHKRRQDRRYLARVEQLAGVLREGERIELFRLLNPVKVAAFVMESAIALVGQRLSYDNPGPVEDDANLLAEVVLNGIARKPGPRRSDLKAAGRKSAPAVSGPRRRT